MASQCSPRAGESYDMQHDLPRSLSDYYLMSRSRVGLLRSFDMSFDSSRRDKHYRTNGFLLSLKLDKLFAIKTFLANNLIDDNLIKSSHSAI